MREGSPTDTSAVPRVRPLSRSQWEQALRRLDLLPGPDNARRRHPRYGVAYGEVQIEFHPDNDPSLPTVRRSAPIYDISAGGLMARCLRPIPPATAVRLHVTIDDRDVLLVGRVRHSTQTIGGYRVGIELIFEDDAAGPPA